MDACPNPRKITTPCQTAGAGRTVAGNCVWALLLCVLSVPVARATDLAESERLYRSGKYSECVAAAAQAIEEGQFSEDWRLLKIRAEMALGRYGDALQTLDAAIERFPYSIRLRWLGRDVCRFNNQAERAKQLTDEIGELAAESSWRFRDAANQIVLGQHFLSAGFDAKKVLAAYTAIKKVQPNNAAAYLASGELALEKYDYALAAESFEQAQKLDPNDPAASSGLARAFLPSNTKKAEAAINAALALNPNHVDSLLLIVDEHIDSERYADAEKLLDRVHAVNPGHPRAWAYRAVLAHLNNDPTAEARCRTTALRPWRTNPEVDHLIGRKLSQKYRFAEGAKYQRRALALDATHLPARMQLATDLLRLGEDEEGWLLADYVHQKDTYNVVAYNLMTLQDRLRGFRTLEEEGFVVRMDEREADIYGQRVLDLLKRAKEQLCPKYDVTIDRPVVVELFPRQQDFAIRTFGLPGGAGFLGVCFGHVITANSPASQAASPSNWEATLWHEFCHAVTLHKTNNKMPRWLSEGISVYEERQADATWGQSITPRYQAMMLGDDLTPVSQLSGAFLNPPTPFHLQFAYYQSSLVVEYLVEKYGLETLQRILVDLGVGMPINESLARYAGSLEALDSEFAEFARQRAEAMAPDADWSEPELPRLADADAIGAWVSEHPNNYPGLQRYAKRLIAEKRWAEALEPLIQMRQLYAAHASADNAFTLLARVYRETGETEQERAVLESHADLSADDVATFARLLELSLQDEQWAAGVKYANRLLAVNPLQRMPHDGLAKAAEKLDNDALAVEANRALLRLDPIDIAGIHFRLAESLARLGEREAAKRHVLLALEEAPRYRAAHRKLLELVEAGE